MKNINKSLYNAVYIIAIILCFVMIAICAWNSKKILREEASWTQVRSHGNGEWLENFEVME